MHEGDRNGMRRTGSTAAMTFELFSPFVAMDTSTVDARLLQALGVSQDVPYSASFDRKPEEDADTIFDFHLEAPDGRRIFFDVKLAQTGFESCEDNEANRRTLERRYLPHLIEQVDTTWLLPETFAQHAGILKKLSWLGRHPASGFVFVFPKANKSLAESENAIKRIVSKSLAPRVAILYLEFLVARILTLTAGDAPLHAHYMRFKEKYIVPSAAG